MDSQQSIENQALLVFELPAKCRYSNTRGKKTQFLNPSCSKDWNTRMRSLPDLAGVKVLTHVGWVLPMQRKGTVTRCLLQQAI